ncbi:hypothetical protein GCM10010377_70040 [Streptomyces viridiviolaceus]|uniref:Uncharacterized protein n=1 Tax=Streptomyces viridiviolaceus TaxID=68282 RepID=A0ABW2EC06_9ACTN|nr:hypothetical protein [Streptomyces viridiviolaceus]GHB69207.1 hypothetical protein GCM10010377_70040 [Streptomyces viridiviolaceus]
MSAPAIVLHESVHDPHAELWFAEPAGFTALPLEALLAEPDAPHADGLRAAAAVLLESAPDEMARQEFIALLASGQRMLRALGEFGIVHCAVGLHRDDVGGVAGGNAQPLLSLFTVSWCATAVAPRAATVARVVTRATDHSHIEYLERASGPLAISESVRRPAAGSGLPPHPVLQIHAHLPHPDCKRLAVLTISTTAMARRAEYRAMLRQIVETVSFQNPLSTGP